MRRTQVEQIWSALPRQADLRETQRNFAEGRADSWTAACRVLLNQLVGSGEEARGDDHAERLCCL